MSSYGASEKGAASTAGVAGAAALLSPDQYRSVANSIMQRHGRVVMSIAKLMAEPWLEACLTRHAMIPIPKDLTCGQQVLLVLLRPALGDATVQHVGLALLQSGVRGAPPAQTQELDGRCCALPGRPWRR